MLSSLSLKNDKLSSIVGNHKNKKKTTAFHHFPKKEEHKIKKDHDKNLPPLQVPKGTNQFCTLKPYCGMLRFPIFAQQLLSPCK